MDLGEVLKTYLSGDQQGQLVIKFVGEDHLCKISIENGQAVYLTLGSLGPTEALDAIAGKVAEWNNFIKGLPARKRLDEPLNQHLLKIAGTAPPAKDETPLDSTTKATPPEIVNVDIQVEAGKVRATINRFIDQIGPLGTIITEKICENLAYTDGSPMNAATYNRFVTALAAEVPENERQGFIDAAAQ
jgi:hypothetical protein